MNIPQANILGISVSAINLEMAVSTIEGWISRREPHYICVTGVHGVMESQRDEELQRIHNAAGLVTPDGMPLVWISRFMGFRHVERVYGPDLVLAVCKRSVKRGYRHFFYGGADGVAERMANRLKSRFSGLKVVGTYSPPFRPHSAEEDRKVVEHINSVQPHIVWVGISTPKQERWMAEHRGQLSAPVLVGVGAAFDLHAGLKRQAPRWMQKSGLEWSYRLMSEPRRLWRRYLVNNPSFLWLIFLRALGTKTTETHGDIKATRSVGRGISIRKLLMMRRSMTTAHRVDEGLHGVWQKPGEHVKQGRFEDR